MRVNSKWLKTIYLKPCIIIDDGEGGSYEGFEDKATIVRANIQPITYRLQGDIYGEKINSMISMLYSGEVKINIGDGFCIDVDLIEKPDYKVVAIKRWTEHIQVDLGRI